MFGLISVDSVILITMAAIKNHFQKKFPLYLGSFIKKFIITAINKIIPVKPVSFRISRYPLCD